MTDRLRGTTNPRWPYPDRWLSGNVLTTVFPIVLGMAVRTLSGVIDTAMIGRLNEAATSIGRSLGQKQPEPAERNRWESLKIGATFMGVPGVTFLVFPEPILRTLPIRKTSYGPG